MKNNPSVIIHMPDMYEAGLTNGREEKWKDRFMTTGATMSLGLIRYLKWPGDYLRFSHNQRQLHLGQFGVYRYDEVATQRLREHLESLDPTARWEPNSTTSLGSYKVSKAFNKSLRETIIRMLGAD